MKLILDSGTSNQNKGSLKISVVPDNGHEMECLANDYNVKFSFDIPLIPKAG